MAENKKEMEHAELHRTIWAIADEIRGAVGSESPVSTQITDVRYEFVQSQLNSNLAFLVDKYTGNVWKYKNKRKGFETIERIQPDIVDTTKVNYQLYMSSAISSMCFLLNVHTGEMWR